MLVAVSRSSPACCDCSRSVCRSGLCESPSRHWCRVERLTAVEGRRTERSSAPAGSCRQESRAYLAAFTERKKAKRKTAIKPNEEIFNSFKVIG